MYYMTIPCNYKYQEEYVPPRCRKPRYREVMATHPVKIPVVTLNDAPIAFKHRAHEIGKKQSDDPAKYRFFNATRIYRAYNGKLYTRVYAGEKVTGQGADGWWTLSGLKEIIMERQTWRTVWSWDDRDLHTSAACDAYFDEMFSEYLLIEVGGKKQVWAETGEPMYNINTFGLGHNHGGIGTSFGITNHYNSNIRKDWYFNALHGAECRKKALEIAKQRGDTDSFSYIRRQPMIQVLMPEMVRRDPKKDHGDGDSFLNAMEDVISGSSSATEAGLLVMATTGALLASR